MPRNHQRTDKPLYLPLLLFPSSDCVIFITTSGLFYTVDEITSGLPEMEGLALATATATATNTATSSSFSGNKFFFPSISTETKKVRSSRRRELWFPKRTKFVVLAAKDEDPMPKLDQYDQMELKFGRLLGEDPKLTLAKIMARKVNPDVSYLEVEKMFHKNKGKIVEIEELPFDVPKSKKASNSLDGLNLVRPVPKKGFEIQGEDKPMTPEIKKPSERVGKVVDGITKSSVPNVILRKKPNMFVEDDDVEDKQTASRLRIKPNLTLKTRNDQSKKFSDMTLLRKPAAMSVVKKQENSDNMEAKVSDDGVGLRVEKEEVEGRYDGFTLLNKPEITNSDFVESSETGDDSNVKEQDQSDEYIIGMQPLENSNTESSEENNTTHSNTRFVDSLAKFSVEATLQGKPKRLDQSVKEIPAYNIEERVPMNSGNFLDANELTDSTSTSPSEDADWIRAEDLLKSGEKVEVELISSSMKGFIVSFGSLVGFLPYRNLASRWKFVAFESWLKQKGINPSIYRHNLGIIGSSDVSDNNSSLVSCIGPEIDQKVHEEIRPDMKLDDLLRIYDQKKLRFLSSFVGQRVKVNVVMADRKLRKLVVSLRPKEKEESIEKKRNLMAKLQIGDVVKCCIKKITYFGIFVEVEGVPALIHQTEVSWDATLDPTSYFKVGQIVEAKVHQLDFALDRIFLSLKEIMPDPMIEALESVVGDHDPLNGRLQAAEADATEWAEVESLIKQLQQIEGIYSVSKGRFFLSPGLAPTFQVYMASMFEDQYKLLARSGNKVQEVIVQASLDKEEMKSIILTCTNRVE